MVRFLNKSIGILGGSFDPAHKGHLAISKIAIKNIKLKRVLWIITKQNPFKKKPLYSLNERMVRAKIMAKKVKKIKVIYLDKVANSSRSVDIINYLIKKRNLRDIYLIIGSDNLIKFHKWKSWKKLVKLTKLIVFSRKGYDKKGMKSIVAKYLKNKIIFIKNKPISISSTVLKNKSRSYL
tara:strand:- start:128 stop:667 length:540 start_codon:yes stop_codon:yes gene_type:complete